MSFGMMEKAYVMPSVKTKGRVGKNKTESMIKDSQAIWLPDHMGLLQ